MKIRIYDVGRMKKSSVVEVNDSADADDIADAMYRAVLKMRALGSRDIACGWDSEAKRGTVYAGFRPVGHAEVIP